MADKLPYSKNIAKVVREGVKKGVSKRTIFSQIQKYQHAPKSTTTFYKLYGQDIADVEADIVGQVGNKVVEQALAGDFKSQELFLRSKGGWSPTATNIEVEADSVEEQENSAIEDLIQMLGFKDEPEEVTKEE